ncbi:hypothetical protein NQ318_000582 [Aromia moschata]|uniref:Uncharacterized protein n=1 Tax=Aromia moschata TaxID=1265417 RepID=A0AAV8XDX2_9CUCU|nr:hypothetical protein NQ318_000582 [Aromia moschata]
MSLRKQALNGTVNRRNCRYWADVNPHWVMEAHTQYPQKVNVWFGIVGNRVVGPYFFDVFVLQFREIVYLTETHKITILRWLVTETHGEHERRPKLFAYFKKNIQSCRRYLKVPIKTKENNDDYKNKTFEIKLVSKY